MRVRLLVACLWLPAFLAARIDLQADQSLKNRHYKPPRFPTTFQATYNFSLPYVKTLQADGLIYPVKVWRNADTKELRIDTYNGVNSLVASQESVYKVIPRLDRLICSDSAENDMFSSVWKASVLPDISDWEYDGHEELRGIDCDVWTFKHRHERKETIYHFHVTDQDTPVRLHMHGNDVFSGAHFDEYIADYLDFSFDTPDDDIFRVPSACEEEMTPRAAGQLQGFAMQMQQLLPSVNSGAIHQKDEEYSMFCQTYGRRHADQEEYDMRHLTFNTHKTLIDEHNAANRTYKLAINKFADWTQEEFLAAMLPRKGMTSDLQPGQNSRLAELPYAPKVPKERLPAAVDWRGTGATGPVKDQATCGSCYAFGAVAAMQSALFMSTGKQVLLSEQQLVDCSWDFGENSACDGGMYDSAMDYVITKAGGAVTEANYEYLGADGFCRPGLSADAVPFKGYSFVPAYDDDALKEALYSRGPLATSIDASQPSFRFYSHGVYDEPACLWKPDDLDHAVALVGYGNSHADEEYWIVRNSWSTHWGDEGYIKVSARHNACGVTSVPMYVHVE